jgi:hypothetical protein
MAADRHLVALLHAHRVLTTDQIQRIMFTAYAPVRSASPSYATSSQPSGSAFAPPGGGSQPWR